MSSSPWLVNGGVLVHASDFWFSSRSSSQNICSPIPDMDCVGNDVSNTTSALTAADCCALCSAESWCRAWSFEPTPHCFLKNDCEHPTIAKGDVSGIVGGALTITDTRTVLGSDDVGVYNGYEITWSASSPSMMIPLVTTFLCYTDASAIAFMTTWPSGATSTNTSDPFVPGTYNSNVAHFPSFSNNYEWAGSSIRYLHVDGIWTLNEVWGTGLLDFSATDSPTWLLNSSAPSMGTLILSPLDSLKAQRVGTFVDPVTHDSLFSAGLYSTVTSIPANFSSRYAIWASPNGVSAAALEWGAEMQRIYKTERLPTSRDIINSKLSYWSDNGATLFQAYWDQHCPTRNCTAVSIPNGTNAEQTFLALKNSHVADNIPVAIYQLDTWWFYQWADFEKGGSLDCTDWMPRADLWPRGIQYVTQHMPLLLYSWGWVTPENGNTMLNFTWIPSIDGKQAMVALDQVYSFYSMIRDRFLTFNGTSYETDNTASFTGGWGQSRESVDSASRYWAGFATPWCEAGIPVQTCESTAGDLLETLRYGCVTSQRDTIDDVPGSHGGNPLVPGGGSEPFFLHRWRVGHDRLLMAALAQRPFFDNVWSVMWQNASTWAGNPEVYVELAWIIAVFTSGAVGFGDFPGDSNRTLIMTACRTDGILLTASLPSYYVDAVYLPIGTVTGLNPTIGRIYQAPSFLADSPASAAAAASLAATRGNYDLSYFSTTVPASAPFLTLLSIDINASVSISPGMLTPDLSPTAVSSRAGVAGMVNWYVALPWARGFDVTAAECADGAPSTPCTVIFSPDQPLAVFTGAPQLNSTHDFELWSLAPVYANGFALLGELNKVIRVSTSRLPWVTPTGQGQIPPELSFGVIGEPGESVSIAVLAPAGLIRLVTVTLPSEGFTTVTCVGNVSTCSESA